VFGAASVHLQISKFQHCAASARVWTNNRRDHRKLRATIAKNLAADGGEVRDRPKRMGKTVRHLAPVLGGAASVIDDVGARDAKREIAKDAKDAKDAEERQTTRIKMNAPQVYAQRLREPAEPLISLTWRSSASWRFDPLRARYRL
jgi:hypothetical protein